MLFKNTLFLYLFFGELFSMVEDEPLQNQTAIEYQRFIEERKKFFLSSVTNFAVYRFPPSLKTCVCAVSLLGLSSGISIRYFDKVLSKKSPVLASFIHFTVIPFSIIGCILLTNYIFDNKQLKQLLKKDPIVINDLQGQEWLFAFIPKKYQKRIVRTELLKNASDCLLRPSMFHFMHNGNMAYILKKLKNPEQDLNKMRDVASSAYFFSDLQEVFISFLLEREIKLVPRFKTILTDDLIRRFPQAIDDLPVADSLESAFFPDADSSSEMSEENSIDDF